MATLDPRHMVRPPHILGVEITQGIQYYGADQHLNDSADHGADNSLPIVAGKPLWVRVYIWGGLLGSGRHFTGQLTGERHEVVNPSTAQMTWTSIGVFFPTRAVRLTAVPDYVAQRSAIAATLNFVLPADVVRGSLRLRVEIRRSRLQQAVPIQPTADTREIHIDANTAQTLRVRGIPVTYNGPPLMGGGTITLPAPGLADLVTTCALTHRLFPVGSDGEYSLAGGITFGTSLAGPMPMPGVCPPAWGDLLNDLREARDDDGNRDDVIYVAAARRHPEG